MGKGSLNEIIESVIEKKLQGKADELGIEFEVDYTDGEDNIPEYVVRLVVKTARLDEDKEENKEIIKDEKQRHREFNEYVYNVIVPVYSDHVRYDYTSFLER